MIYDPTIFPCVRYHGEVNMPRVLIVDDDQAIREVLHEIVTLYSYDCETAQSAKEAI